MARGFPTCVGLALSLWFCTVEAKASDQCSDVLAQGTFQTSTYRDNSYFQQIIYSRFVRSTYQSSKTDRAGGFAVPVGEIVLGANYTEAQYNQKRAELQSTYFNQITASREIDIALASGDPGILSAWTACMAGRGGLSLRFEPTGPTDILVLVQYHSRGSLSEDRLTEDAILPGATIVTGASCFQRDTRIVANVPCRATLRMNDALTPLAVSLNSREGGAQAYLPPRISRVTERRAYPFTEDDRLFGSYFRRTASPERTIALSPAEIADGWTFDPQTARATVERTYGGGMNNCHSAISEPDLHRFRYGYSVIAHSRGNDRNWSVNCIMHLSIMMMREKWVPMVGPPAQNATGVLTRPPLDLNALPNILSQVPSI